MAPQAQYRILKFPLPVPFLSQIDTFHAPQSTSWKSISLLSFTQACFSKCSISLNFPPTQPVQKIPLSDTCYTTCPIHSSDLINRTTFGDEYWSQSSSLYSLLHSCLTSSLLDPNVLLSTLFTNILTLHSSLNEERRNFTPIQTTGKYKILNIFNYIFLERKVGRNNFFSKW